MIEEYFKSRNKLIEYFILTYFNVDEYNIIFDVIGTSVINFADFYFDLGDIIYCLDNKVSKEDFFAYYDWSMDNPEQRLTLQQFLLDPIEKARQEEQYLKELEERVKTAEIEFKEALNKYKA